MKSIPAPSYWDISDPTVAVVLAVIHLLFFSYINGKQSSEDFSPLPQSYITTISTILVTSFATSLRLSLADAFTQYFWHILRQAPHRVITIENLFEMKDNPFLVVRNGVLGATLTLCSLVVLNVVSKVAVSFVPGALTITPQEFTNQTMLEVPFFNVSSIASENPGTTIFIAKLAVSSFRASKGNY